MKYITTIIFMLGFTLAYAHSKLEQSIPNNGATLDKAPEFVALMFAKKIRLTKLSVVDKKQTTNIEHEDKKNFIKKITIPFKSAEAGNYKIKWRGLGIDGHIMSGEISFKVAE